MAKDLRVIKQAVMPVISEVYDLEIVDSITLARATKYLSQANKYLDSVIAYKEAKTIPLTKALKVIRDETRALETQLDLLVESLRDKMTDYQTELVRVRKEEEAKIAKRVAPGKGNLSLDTAIERIDELDTVEGLIETNEGSVTFIEVQKFEVTDKTKLPPEYLLADETAIRKAMKEGKELPGVRYYVEQVPRNLR